MARRKGPGIRVKLHLEDVTSATSRSNGKSRGSISVEQKFDRWWNTVLDDVSVTVGNDVENEARQKLIGRIEKSVDHLVRNRLGPYIARFMSGAKNRPALGLTLTPQQYFNTGYTGNLSGIFGSVKFVNQGNSQALSTSGAKNTLSSLGVNWDPLRPSTLAHKRTLGQSSFFKKSGTLREYFASGAGDFVDHFTGTQVSFRKVQRYSKSGRNINRSKSVRARLLIGTLSVRIFPMLDTSIRSTLASGTWPGQRGQVEKLVDPTQQYKLTNPRGAYRPLLGPLLMWWYQVIIPLHLARSLNFKKGGK